MKCTTLVVPLVVFAAACTNAERTWDRTKYLNFAGPELPETAAAIRHLRRFSPDNIEALEKDKKPPAVETLSPIKGDEALLATRAAAFAHIDRDCDKYIDAIFWAARARKTTTTSIGLAGAATSTILAATGVGTTAIAVTAAAFGLSTGLVDAYYETFLYSLEPSGVVGIIDKARAAYRSSPELKTPRNEGQLLAQVQGYIRQCSPPTIEALVNAAIKRGEVTATEKKVTKPLTKDEVDEFTKLSAKGALSATEALRLFSLNQRLITAGVSAEPAPAPAGPAAAAAGNGANPAFIVPTTRILE